MKLDEITVTFHPHNAKIPDVIITDDKHVIIGIIIHLNCLNIKYKTSIKNMNIDNPNTFKSFLTNFYKMNLRF